MRHFRKLGTAMALSMFIGASMVTFGTTVHAAGLSGGFSIQVRCTLLLRAIGAASAYGLDSLAAYLQGQFDANCTATTP
jgi:hypothetical protein